MSRLAPADVSREPQRRRVMAKLELRRQATVGPDMQLRWLSEPARRLRALSIEAAGETRALEMAGHSPTFLSALAKVEKIARYREPVLITGESGVGKEQFAQALYLLGGS